ncbi:MAG TPA: DUF4402 domain-containing protein [Sphingomicrobium sp.]|nr:DUF4402 domain-containing protein [Sphingomicrobium sp.]
MSLKSALVMLMAGVGLASSVSATAQCRLCATPTTSRDDNSGKNDVRLEIETGLSFDRLILSGLGDGTAMIRPDGSRAISGAIAEISPRAMVGTVVVRGEPGRAIRVVLPNSIVLHSLSGGQVVFDDVASDLPSMPRLDSAGNLTFRFGGRLRVSGDADGEYRGDLPITAEYL